MRDTPRTHTHPVTLVTSNPRKLAAFRDLGMPMAMSRGMDLPEVAGTPTEVAVRKAEAAGAHMLVEDTVLHVDGRPVVDIRWHIDGLGEHAGAAVLFTVTLAENDGVSVRLWSGTMTGTLGPASTTEDSFGFDPYVYPDDAGGLSLDDLARAGRTTEFSARARAVHAYLHEAPCHACLLADLEPWTGGWQGDEPGESQATPNGGLTTLGISPR